MATAKKKAPAKKAAPKKGDEPVRMGRSTKQSADSAGKFKPTDTAGDAAPTDMSKRFGENFDSGFFFNTAGKKQAYGQGRTGKRFRDQEIRASLKKRENSTGKDQPVRAGRKAQGTGGKSYADTAMKRGNTGDLAGRGGPIQKVYKGGDTSISIGIPERGMGRTNKRAADQFKRKKK
jgi:hypothetical protein